MVHPYTSVLQQCHCNGPNKRKAKRHAWIASCDTGCHQYDECGKTTDVSMHYSWLSGFSLARVTAEQIGSWWQFSGSTLHSWTPGQGWHFCLQFICWLWLHLLSSTPVIPPSYGFHLQPTNGIFFYIVMRGVIKAKNSEVPQSSVCGLLMFSLLSSECFNIVNTY